MKLIDHKLDPFMVPNSVWRSDFHFRVYVWWHATWRVSTFLVSCVKQQIRRGTEGQVR